jgi:hypothetical protein
VCFSLQTGWPHWDKQLRREEKTELTGRRTDGWQRARRSLHFFNGLRSREFAMRRLLSLLSVGVCAVAVAVSATTAADIEAAGGVLPSAVRLHNVRPTPQQALQSRLLQQRAMQDPSFAPLMTYAEVPSRTPRPLYESVFPLTSAHDWRAHTAHAHSRACRATSHSIHRQPRRRGLEGWN